MRALAVLVLAMPLAHAAPADFVGAYSPVAPPAALAYPLGRIDAEALRKHIAWLADPQREGRGLGTRGLIATADYIAGQLAAAGVGPPGAARAVTDAVRISSACRCARCERPAEN